MNHVPFGSASPSTAATDPFQTGAALGRRTMLAAGLATTAGLVLTGATPAAAVSVGRAPHLPAVVLVHGAFVDGSSWSGVVLALQRAGMRVVAVQLDLDSIAEDAETVQRAIVQVGGPVILVGHSYGGAVVTAAGQDNPAVKALVYAAAFAPDEGETLGELSGRFPPTPVLKSLVPDSSGRLIIDRAAFPAVFAPDVPRHRARVLAAVQGSVSGATFAEPLTGVPAWRQVPTWFQVSALDQVVHPDLQRFFAARMIAKTSTLSTGHASPVSRPRQIAGLIQRAAIAVC